MKNITIRLVLLALLLGGAAFAADQPRDQVVKIVTQIRRADYEGDRAALQRLYGDLTPFVDNKDLGSRVRYWRGFALWRRTLNGFNDGADRKEMEADLNQAVSEFRAAFEIDPEFVDAKLAAASCLGNLVYINMKDPARVQELVAQSSPLLKQAQAAQPDNPRLLWVEGPIYWTLPAERGGSQDKAFELYQKGLQSARIHKNVHADPLEPTWGEPELLMNLAWSNLNRTTPDLNAAEQYAQSALEIVPYWHYVRDILLPQIKAAKGKRS